MNQMLILLLPRDWGWGRRGRPSHAQHEQGQDGPFVLLAHSLNRDVQL